jgi:hypothetical protein
VVTTDVKSRAGRRTVGIPHRLVLAIEQHRERQAVERARAANLWRDEDWVFTNHVGGPVHPTGQCADPAKLALGAHLRGGSREFTETDGCPDATTPGIHDHGARRLRWSERRIGDLNP